MMKPRKNPKSSRHLLPAAKPARSQTPSEPSKVLVPRQPHGIWVVAHVVARRGKEKQLRSLLRRMVAPTHAEKGCLIYDLYEAEKHGNFYFYELWATRKDLARHAISPHFRRLQQGLPALASGSIEVNLLHKLHVNH